LSAAERRAYVLADNKLALNAGWDNEILAIELQTLIDIDFDVSLTGFSLAEIDLTFDQAGESAPEEVAPADVVPEPPASPISRRGDLWSLGRHRLLCGDARNRADYGLLLGDERAGLIFTDPPYNVRIDGNVCAIAVRPD
jgi:ParB-like chromosome segregation protein Spo0J